MLDQPTELTPWERDRIKLDFALFVAKRARRFHVDPEGVIGVITGQVSPDIARMFSTEAANEKALATSPEGEGLAPTSRSTTVSRYPYTSPDGIDLSGDVIGADRNPAHPDRSPVGASGRADGDGLPSATPSQPERSEAPRRIEAGSVATSPAPTRADRIRELHARHPRLTATEASDMLGIRVDHLRAVSKQIGVTWCPAKRGRPIAISSPASARSPDQAPTPAPPTERSPAPAVEREPHPFANTNTHVVRKPKGTRFYLRNDAGEYLHNSCQAMTRDKAWAWIGGEQHIVAVRRQFPLARDLREVVVPKEQERAA